MSAPAPAQRLGPYELIAPIGAGGMGEVWRARDTRLNRYVAIKFSRAQFTDRFQREAQAIAALNHPNICTLHDVGPNYLVMELVEGPSLAERIAEGPLPLDEAIGIATHIANALEAAHLKGIVHRDLKPGNVKIAPDGTVKVLDFGLAKMPMVSSEATSDSPTLMSPATQFGMILGTAAYMAPEQARGKPVDKRADIWAFGVVLYEMVTGKRLFQGDDVAETLASVVKDNPDLSGAPPRLQRLLRKCLEKDPKKRLRDISGVELLLENGNTEISQREARPRGSRAAWVVAAIATLIASAITVSHFREKPPAERVMRLSVPLPEDAVPGFLALSPDGRRLVVMFYSGKEGALYIRPLDSGDLHQLPDTKDARSPFWSPDSRFIGFFADNKLKVIPASGGPARVLCEEAGAGGGGSWSTGGMILFGDDKGLRRVDSNGGNCVRMGMENTPSNLASAPTFLPDGKHFFYVRSTPANDQIGVYLATLDSPIGRRILADHSGVAYTPPVTSGGHSNLIFLRESALMAQSFDMGSFQPVGDPFPVARPAAFSFTAPQLSATASADGTLAYLTGSYGESQLTWFDRTGKELGKAGPRTVQVGVALSPDGKSALTFQRHQDFNELWSYDLTRPGSESRLTSRDHPVSSTAVWSPDGTRALFGVNGIQGEGLYQKDVRSGQEDLIAKANPDEKRNPSDLSRDERYLIYTDLEDPKKEGDIWYLPLQSGKAAGPPVMVVGTNAGESQGQLSPDGKWLAYCSGESGTASVYVRPFPSGSGVWKASVDLSFEPRWRADGKELFFAGVRSGGTSLMAVTVSPDGRGGLNIGAPQKLFDYHAETIAPQGNIWSYSPDPDGQRFLVNEQAEKGRSTVNLILHWQKAVGETK